MRNPRRACRDRPQHGSAVRRLQAGPVIEDTDRNTIHVAPPLNSQKHDGPPKRTVLILAKPRYGWPDYLLVLALARLARHSRNSRYSGSRSCGARAAAGAATGATSGADGAGPQAAAAPAGSGMLRSSHSCAALKRVHPDTVARGAISFHFGWNGGRCNCATLSNIVSTRSERRR